MAKAYVLLSGGIDSSTCLAKAIKDFGSVMAVSVHYGQRHTRELTRARQVAEQLGTENMLWNISGMLGRGGLTDDALQIPKTSYDKLPHGVSPTYVPFRNGTLLAVIASIASTDKEAEAIFFGAHAEDAENWVYPDCTPEFIGGMANAIYIGTYCQIRLHTPLMFMSKAEVVELGTKLGVPWELTWSCYEGRELHCGECPTCLARMLAFNNAGVPDPTEYATQLGS